MAGRLIGKAEMRYAPQLLWQVHVQPDSHALLVPGEHLSTDHIAWR